MTDETIDLLAQVLPAPVLEIVVDVSTVVVDILHRVVEWLNELLGHYTYN